MLIRTTWRDRRQNDDGRTDGQMAPDPDPQLVPSQRCRSRVCKRAEGNTANRSIAQP